MSTRFAKLLQKFFTHRLSEERDASPNTVSSYSVAFQLLLGFLQDHRGQSPPQVELEDLDASTISAFLRHLEEQRGNSPRTCNARLAAIHSFFHYVAPQEPRLADQIQQVLAIPTKRWEQKPVDYLLREETEAILDAIDRQTASGQRDWALLALLAQTGLRVSEATTLRCEGVVLGKDAYVRCLGKGRKQRCVPLRKGLAKALSQWLKQRDAQPSDLLFTNARGGALSRDGVAYLLNKHVAAARETCPSLAKKRVTPHVLRHTLAMDLLHHGVGRTVMALWLGHASVESIQCYLHASLQLKQDALDKTEPWNLPAGRYRPPDDLLAFLESLVMPSGLGRTACNPQSTGGLR